MSSGSVDPANREVTGSAPMACAFMSVTQPVSGKAVGYSTSPAAA